MDWKVVIYKNDLKRSHVWTIKAWLTDNQARRIAQDLNGAFASNGLNWFAEAEEMED
jgi:hypothetical protein